MLIRCYFFYQEPFKIFEKIVFQSLKFIIFYNFLNSIANFASQHSENPGKSSFFPQIAILRKSNAVIKPPQPLIWGNFCPPQKLEKCPPLTSNFQFHVNISTSALFCVQQISLRILIKNTSTISVEWIPGSSGQITFC